MVRPPLIYRAAGVAAALFTFVHCATADLLAPGGLIFPAPFQAEPVNGVLLASVTAPFASADLQGNVISEVYAGDLSNPWGGLTFTYQVTMGPNSPHAVSQFSVGYYGGFQTDVSYNNLVVNGVNPFAMTRSAGMGDVVRFIFFPGIDGGAFSSLMVVQTDALNYQDTIASVINASAATVASFAPTGVPEPALAALAVLGGALLLGLRRQW